MYEQCFDNVSVLVIGFDGYKDVWNHCFSLMNTYWKNRPVTYLASSNICPKYENVINVVAGEKTEWSLKAKTALERIKTKYVILLLEDFFITDFVDNNNLLGALDLIEKNKLKFYQLTVQLIKSSWEKGKPFNGNRHLHIIPKDKKYGLNLQAAIWDREFLINLIGCGNYNAWQFELNQLGKQDYNDKILEFIIDDRNILNITHAIVQSKYLRGAKAKLRRIGHYVDDKERQTLSIIDDFKYNFKLLMYSLIPKPFVKVAKKMGKLMKIDFVTDRLNK